MQGYEKFSSREYEPRPLKSVRTKVYTSVRWTTSVDADNWSLKQVYSPSLCSLRKQPTLRDATTGFPTKWRISHERRNSILITLHYPELSSASGWSYRVGH